jgi:DNA-binding transcriptional LysR family regulator
MANAMAHCISLVVHDNMGHRTYIDEPEAQMPAASDMRALVLVAQHQSFSGAAAALELTPSAVSKLVSRLEERLGVRLLHRTTRRLALTSEGDVYLARARQILADIEDMEAEVARSRGAPRGRLHVNTSNGFGVHQLAPALPDFLARYPDVEVELSITDRIVDLVADHADVTIRAGRINDLSLAARKIADFERTICAAPSYLARHGMPRAPADLAGHICIIMAHQTPSRWAFRTREGIDDVEIAARVTTDNADVSLRLALEGAGIVRLADVIVGEPIRRGLLVPLLTDVHYAEPLPLSALYLAGRHRLPKVRVFLDFLEERFGSAPWRTAASVPAPTG